MTNRAVLDTSAILALLFDEPGAEATLARGRSGVISAVCYSEALAKSIDRGVPVETCRASIDGLRLAVMAFDGEHAVAAAGLRAATRHLDVSFADRACLATALLARLPVLTADRAWTECDLGLEIVLIR